MGLSIGSDGVSRPVHLRYSMLKKEARERVGSSFCLLLSSLQSQLGTYGGDYRDDGGTIPKNLLIRFVQSSQFTF